MGASWISRIDMPIILGSLKEFPDCEMLIEPPKHKLAKPEGST